MTFWKFLSSLVALGFVLLLKLRALLGLLGLVILGSGIFVLWRRYEAGDSLLAPAVLSGVFVAGCFILAFLLPNTRILTLLFA